MPRHFTPDGGERRARARSARSSRSSSRTGASSSACRRERVELAAKIAGNGGGIDSRRARRARGGGAGASASRSRAASNAIHGRGAIVKDLDAGLVDFPARRATARRSCSAGGSARTRLHTGTGWKKGSQDASRSIPNRTSPMPSGNRVVDRGDRRSSLAARAREARRQGAEPARARARGGDALPDRAPRRDDDDRLRRRALGAARHPAGARDRRRHPRVVGGHRARHRLRRAADDRQRRRRDPDRVLAAAAARRLRRSSTTSRARSRRSG